MVVQDIVKMQSDFFKTHLDVSDSHSGHVLVLFCGAEAGERFAEILALSLVSKEAKQPKPGKSLA